MLTLLLALLIVHAWWAPDSWTGPMLTRLTIGGIRRLGSIRPTTVACFIVVVTALAALIAYGKIEGLIMAGLAAPETFAMFFAFDVGLAVEVLVVAWLAAGRGNLRMAVRHVRSMSSVLARLTPARPRSRKVQRPRRQAEPANDDEPGWATLGLVGAIAA